MRVAYASPLPPLTSGIADYSRALAPRLADEGLEIDLYYEGRVAPPTEAGLGRWPLRPVRELPAAAAGYDLVLYHLGNSLPHHAGILDALLAAPGVVVLHEYMLHHLMRERTLVAGDPGAYVAEMRYAAGETGRRAAQRLLDTHHPLDVWSFPLFERVVDRSRAVVVHSEFARARILASRPRARVETAPFPVEPEPAPASEGAAARARAEARAALGLPAGAFVVGAFGLVTPQKRLAPALAAFARLRRERPEARFLVAGEVSPHYDFEELLREHGGDGAGGVTVTGRLAPERFRGAVAAVDLAVNLRHPTGGETSASLLHLLAAGVPTAVSAQGSFAELPDGTVAKVPLDEREPELLLELYRAAAADPSFRRALGAAGRAWVERVHALPRSARVWAERLRALAVATAGPGALPEPPGPHDARRALAESLGADLADLGLGAAADDLLGELASTLVDLGLAPTPRR
jgi:glycosyltransferase involved in cell wall biosynthesis